MPALLLVVDDEDADRYLAARALREAGYEVISAASAVSAIRELERNTPSAIVLDLMMPGADGSQFLRTLRSLDYQIPVVLVSHLDTYGRDHADELAALGAVFVSKGGDFRAQLTEAVWRVTG